MDGINNLFDRDVSNFSAALAGKYDLGKKSCRKISKKIKKLIPHLQIEIVKDAGHAAIYDQPDEVNRKVLDFLKSST